MLLVTIRVVDEQIIPTLYQPFELITFDSVQHRTNHLKNVHEEYLIYCQKAP